jgi:hypothetical protein
MLMLMHHQIKPMQDVTIVMKGMIHSLNPAPNHAISIVSYQSAQAIQPLLQEPQCVLSYMT